MMKHGQENRQRARREPVNLRQLLDISSAFISASRVTPLHRELRLLSRQEEATEATEAARRRQIKANRLVWSHQNSFLMTFMFY